MHCYMVPNPKNIFVEHCETDRDTTETNLLPQLHKGKLRTNDNRQLTGTKLGTGKIAKTPVRKGSNGQHGQNSKNPFVGKSSD